jgi:hypothetical protein
MAGGTLRRASMSRVLEGAALQHLDLSSGSGRILYCAWNAAMQKMPQM